MQNLHVQILELAEDDQIKIQKICVVILNLEIFLLNKPLENNLINSTFTILQASSLAFVFHLFVVNLTEGNLANVMSHSKCKICWMINLENLTIGLINGWELFQITTVLTHISRLLNSASFCNLSKKNRKAFLYHTKQPIIRGKEIAIPTKKCNGC